MDCIKCKAELPEGALYCPRCGKKQTPEKRKALKRPNGMGTVYRLSGRRRRSWVAAKNRVVLGYYETKTDALAALERTSGRPVSRSTSMTFEEVYKEWSEEKFPQVGQSAKRLYEMAFRNSEALYKRRFRDIAAVEFQKIIDAQISSAYQQKQKSLYSQMSKWAIEHDVTEKNFAERTKAKGVQAKEKRVFTEEEIQRIEQDGSEAARIVLMMIATGMRIGELLALKLSDYHGDYVVGGEKTKAGRNRVIPIRAEGRKHFEYFRACATGELFMSGCSYRDYFQLREKGFIPLMKKLGIEGTTMHSARHTYASRAVREGLRPEILQRVLGHASYETTLSTYTHLSAQDIVSEVESVSNAAVTERNC